MKNIQFPEQKIGRCFRCFQPWHITEGFKGNHTPYALRSKVSQTETEGSAA